MAFLLAYFYLLLQALLVNANAQNGIFQRDAPACAPADNLIAACSSLNPGFLDMAPTDQALCLCYSSTVWVPTVFDNEILTCIDYLYTASPSEYSSVVALEYFCSSVGPVAGATAPNSAAASTTAAPTAIATATGTGGSNNPSSSACTTAVEIYSSCEAATSGFSDLPGSQQASCICYTGATWNPTGFDGPVQTCADFLKTADVSDYENYSTFIGFCSKEGDVVGGSGSPSTRPAKTLAAATSTLAAATTTPVETATQSKGAGGLGGTQTQTQTPSKSAASASTPSTSASTSASTAAPKPNSGTALRSSTPVDFMGFALLGVLTISCVMMLMF